MNLKAPVNNNYAAVVTRITALVPLAKCDNIVGAPLFGFQAIVGLDTQVGQLGVVFTVETQLSEKYTSENNLYRHNTYNADQTKTGYLEDTRRVRALKLRGHRSDSLFMPLESLAFTGADLTELKPGDTFDELNGHAICKKYVVRQKEGSGSKPKDSNVKFTRVDSRLFPEHMDSDVYWRVAETLDPEATAIVTQKIHGTSIRIGHVPVKRKLGFRDKLAKVMGVRVLELEHDMVYGSRKVIKDANNPNQKHYYDNGGVDLWTAKGKELDGLIPPNFLVYGELVGWVGDKPIQRHYTYAQERGTSQLYVYRVAVINHEGFLIDLSWDQTRIFCANLGLETVKELWRGKVKEFQVDDWLDKKYHASGLDAIPLSPDSPVDEGVCLRIEGLRPNIVKAKGPQFFLHETKLLDTGEEDLESSQSEPVVKYVDLYDKINV